MGKSSSQTIGHRYFLGVHFVIGIAPMDGLLAVRFQDKIAWQGQVQSGRININKPTLFGGKKKEGGVVGAIDILDGASDQPVNDYLAEQLDGPVPAFRGVTSAVFRKPYIGNNPFLKPVAFKPMCVYSGYDDWKHDKAGLCGQFAADDLTVYLAIDNSFSMHSNGYIDTAKAAVKSWLQRMRGNEITIKMVAFSAQVDSAIELSASTTDHYDQLEAWVDAIPAPTTGVVTLECPISSAVKASNASPIVEPAASAGLIEFRSPGWPTTNYSSLTQVSYIADEAANKNTAQEGVLFWDIDISGVSNGETISFASDATVQVINNPLGWDWPYETEVRFRTWNGSSWTLQDSDTVTGVTAATTSHAHSMSFTKGAGQTVLRVEVDIPAVVYSSGIVHYAVRSSNIQVSYAGADGADWEKAVESAPDFFGTPTETDSAIELDGVLSLLRPASADESIETQRALIFVSEGIPAPTTTAADAKTILDGITDLDRYAYNIVTTDTTYSDMIDNTAADGVPVLANSEDEISGIFAGLALSWLDINPVHVLRELIISPVFGGGDDDSVIGDSFATAADTIYSEGMGISLFGTVNARDEIKREIEKHIDAAVFFSRSTGKWEIKLLRDDYDTGTLDTIDGSNVVDWGDVERPTQDDLPNQISIVYTKRFDGSTASVTTHNIAAVQEVGTIIPESVEMPYFTCEKIVGRIADREMVARTVPLWRGVGTQVTHLGPDLNVGSPILVDLSTLGRSETIVARITEIDDGGHTNSGASINWVEDKFAIDDTPIVSATDDVGTVDRSAVAPAVTFAEEATYYTLAIEQDQAQVDGRLDEDPDYGAYIAAPSKPNGLHIDATIAQQNGAAWEDVGSTGLMPYAVVTAAVGRGADEVEITLEYNSTLDDIEAGALCSIDNEIMRVDDMSQAGDVVTLTVGRGCIDTVPAAHAVGSYVVFWSEDVGTDGVVYTAGETTSFKLLPRTSSAVLSPDNAVTDSVTFDSRAIRPYRVGKLQVDGEYQPTDVKAGTITATWAHRDRTMQTTLNVEDFTDASIGPESGVSYTPMMRLAIYQDDIFDSADIFDNADFLISDTYRGPYEYSTTTGTTHDFSADSADLFDEADLFDLSDMFSSAFDATVAGMQVGVKTTRDGYDNWQTPWVDIAPLLPPINITATEV